MFSLDRSAKINNTLSANELAQTFNWYWKFHGLEIPWLGGLQVMQKGFVEPHEQHRTAFYHRVMTIGSLNFGGNNVLASISYRLAKRHEKEFDLEAYYTLDRTSAYKTRRIDVDGKFIMASAKILNSSEDTLSKLFNSYKKLDEDTLSLSDWLKSERQMFVTCDNSKCRKFRLSKCFEPSEVRGFALQKTTLDNLTTSLRCSDCGHSKPKVSAFPVNYRRTISVFDSW